MLPTPTSEQVEKYSQPGCFLCTSQNEKKCAEAQAALAALEAPAAAAKAEVAAATAALAPAQQLAAGWGAKAAEMEAAERARASLLESMFSQPHWEAVESVRAASLVVSDLQRQAGEASTHSSTYGRAEGLLRSADDKLQGAQRAMGGAQVRPRLRWARLRRARLLHCSRPPPPPITITHHQKSPHSL